MKAQDFQAWMERMGIRFGADVERLLGVGRNQAVAWVTTAGLGKDVPIKKSVALAMTALANDLKPWDEYER